MELIAEKILELDNADSIMKIYGRFDENVKEIEKKFNVRIHQEKTA